MLLIRPAVLMLAFVFCATALAAQECRVLNGKTEDEFVNYLETHVPDANNAQCVTFAIQWLGRVKYQPASSVLSKLLDFRRPQDPIDERMHSPFPAVTALEEIGESSLPYMLEILKKDDLPSTTRQNALSVWFEVNKYKPSKGILVLRRAEESATDPTVKKSLNSAISKIVGWCGAQEKAQCELAAQQRQH